MTSDLTIEELRQERDERKLHPSHELVLISAGELVSLYDQLLATMRREAKYREALHACLRFYGSKEAFGDDATINNCAVQFAIKCEPLIHAALNHARND